MMMMNKQENALAADIISPSIYSHVLEKKNKYECKASLVAVAETPDCAA